MLRPLPSGPEGTSRLGGWAHVFPGVMTETWVLDVLFMIGEFRKPYFSSNPRLFSSSRRSRAFALTVSTTSSG